MSKDTNNKKTSSQTAPQEDKFSYINNLVNNSNKILNNKAISEESKKYSSLFENSLIANQLGKTQELLPGDVRNITGGADYEKVQDILGQGYNIFDGSLNVRKALGDKQSGWAQAGGALNQAIVGEFIGGTIESTGRLLDIKGSIDLYNGNIKEFDNVLTELGSGLKGWAEHSTPIFGSDEMFSSGWWAKGLVTTASSLSLLIPAMGTVRAVGGLFRALGVLKSMETLSKAGRTAAWIRTGISQAVVSRHMENWLEAREVWDNTLNEYVNNKGLSLEEAEQAASKAVRQSYIFNTAMLVFDIPQYLLIGRKTFGSSEASDKIMSALGKSKSSILGSRAKALGINMASEGFEEAYQYVVGNEVVNYQMYKDGLASNPVSDKFLSGYMKDNEFWTSVIFGALGAGVHSGVGKMFNKAFYSKKLETNDNLRIENFKKTQEIQKRIYNKLAKAYESNNQEAVESAIEELTYLSALNSYEFGNSDIALETMGMIKDASNEELVAMGLPEDKIDEFKANIDNAINQTKDIFKKLKKNSKIFGDEVNKEVTTTELQLEKIDRLINNSEKSITEKRKELEKSQDLKNLSPEEQQILENKLFIDGGKSRINAINEALQKNNQLTEEQIINFETQKAEIEQLVKEKSKANKELVTGLTGSSYLSNVFSDKGLSSISTLFDEEFNSISASVNDNNVSSREEYLSSLDKSKREKLESLEKRLDKISKANELYTAELQKELAKHGIFKLRQKELQKNLDYYTSEKYIKEKKQIIEEVRKKQAEAAQQAINDEKVADDTINSKINQNKKTNEAETTTVPGFNEVVENLNNKVKQKTEEQGYDAEKVDFVNNYFNASKNNDVNEQIKNLLDKNKIYNFFSTLNEDSELSDLESAIYDYFSNPTEVNFNKIKTLAKEDNSYNKESDVFKAEEAIKEIENQAEEEVKAEIVAAKKVVAINQSNEIPETTNNSLETNVLDENEDVFESDIREYKEYDEESSGAVSVEPTSLAWRSSSAMDNLEEDNDVELTKFLENPSIDITEFNAEFEIDENYLKQNKPLYDKLNSGETLTQEDINNIPIKVYFLNKEGNRVKNRNNEDLFSYLHANDFWNGKNIQSVNPEDLKKELAIFKFNILKKLQNNEKAISKILNQKDGILQEDYEMVLNPATNKKERKLIFKPLSEAIALDENEIEFLFGDSFNQYILGNTIDQESLQHTTATPGALYIKFKKPNGKVFPARVFVRRLDNNDVNALFSILNYAYVQNQTLKTEISKLSTELQKELKSSQFVKDLIDVLGSKATLLDVLNNFVYEGKLSQGKGLNELRKVGNDVFINGKKYNVVDFTTDKKNEIKAELAKKMINISAKKLNQSSYKKILIDNNVVQTHIRLKKGYVTPFSTPTTVISNRLEGDSTNQSSDVEERFDDETTKQFTQEADIEKKLQELKNYFNDNTRSTADSRYNPDISGEGELALREQEEQLLQLRADIIQAHGLTKGSIGQQFKDLLDILTKGLDNRGGGQLYTAPLVMPEDSRAGAGSALGTGGGTAYVDGAFIILAKKGINEIKSVNDIGGILVNQAVSDSLPELVSKLKQLFPNLSIESYSNSVNAISEINAKYDAELAELNKPTQSNKADEIKADIEKRRQESNKNQLNEIGSNRFLKFNKEGENTELSEVELKLINSLIDRMISQGKSAKEINAGLIGRGFVQSQATSPAQIETYLQSRIDGKINSKVGESISQEINAKYDAELNKLTQPSNKANEIKSDIERLEKEKQDLLNKPSQESEVKEVTPSKVDTYLGGPNQDGSFDSSSARMSFIPGASIMAFESIGNNKFAVYISKNDAAVKLALQYRDRRIDPVFEGASYFNPKAKEIQVIKPAIVELQGDKYVLVEKGLIDYDNVGINKSKETKTKPDTSNIDTQIAQKQAELAVLEKRKPEIVNRYSDSDVKSNPDKIYVFGDNVQRTGTGGQAQIRNNSNAFGIATKLKPSNNQDAFMSDNDLESNKKIIDSDIQKILNQNKPLVFPKSGFGTGLAKLKEKAPKTYEYLRQRLLEEFYFDNENGKIIENNEKLAALESKQEVVENENVIDKDNESEKNKLLNIRDVGDISEFDDFVLNSKESEDTKTEKVIEQKVDNFLENEFKEDVEKIAKEENLTVEEVKQKVKDNLNNKNLSSFSKSFKNLIDKIKKLILTLFVSGAIIAGTSSFSLNKDGTVSFDIFSNIEIENIKQWGTRFLDKQGLIEVADNQIVKESSLPKIVENIKPQKIFEIIGSVPDSYNSSDTLLSYRSQWDNSEGFRYIPVPVKKDLPKGGMKISGVVGVGHFLLDASISDKTYSHENNKVYLRNAKRNNDWIPAFEKNKDNSVTLKYKKYNNLTKNDIVVSPLRQFKFTNIDFNKSKKPEGFKSSIKEVKTKDGKGTYLIFKDKDGYSRFSGGSVVFIFNDSYGNTIVRDFAGSINQIKLEGENITNSYNLNENDLVIGYHDVGSFSAKPKAKNNEINTQQWSGFNPSGETGGALLIPTEGNINNSKPINSVFSTKQTPQKTDSDKLNEAVEVLNKILPKEVAITLQDDLIKIFENGDAAVASFSKAGIILSSFADDTDAYHEAFHAVFRLLLSGKERNSLIENSKNDFLEPTDEQIKILMDRHNLSKEEATDLYYEEILADEFGKYMSNPNEYTFNNKEQKSFFEKLLSWINNILGIKSNREKVFSSIRKGDYSNSKQAKDSLANLDVNSTELAMFNNEVNYMLKSVEILQSDKAKQVFAKAEKNNWDLNKTLTELQIPKEQKQLILDLGINNREEIALELASKYSYTVEVNTAKSKEDFSDSDTQEIVFTTQSGIRYYGDYQENYFSKNKETISKEEFVTALNNNRSINNSSYYANLTVPGGTNYTENEISTPAITPSIKGHAQFATDKGIGWFRSDEQGKSFVADNQYEADIYEELGYTKINGTSKPTYIEKSKTRRILEVQSDLFQKGRDKESLIPNKYSELKISLTYDRELHYVNNKWILIRKPNSEEKQKLPPIDRYNNNYRIKEILSDEKGILLFNDYKKSNENSSQYEKSDSQNKKNQFLQLLNKNNNWVTFFVKSIVQDSAKKGYEKVLFPTGNTASKIEGHDTLEEFKREKEDRIKKLEEKNKDYEEKVQQNRIEKTKGNPEATGNIIYYRTNIEDNNNEINQLKQELERVEKEGFGALRPIYNFYENTVTNILKKQGYNAELITDEYGNTWNEVTIKQSRDLSPIVFKTKNRIVESKSEQLSYSNYFEARMNKPGNPLSEQQFNSLSLTEQEVLINQTKYC